MKFNITIVLTSIIMGNLATVFMAHTMDKKEFWSIIEYSIQESGGDQDKQIRAMDKALSVLPERELVAFGEIFDGYENESYHWDLWAAAYIINGGCSDDGFEYFRSWLIAQGETVYTNAMDNPETLIGKAVPDHSSFEIFGYVPYYVFDRKFGKNLWEIAQTPSWQLKGEPWDEDRVYDKYPKLAAWVENF